MTRDASTGGGAVAPMTLVTDDGFPLAATRFKRTGPQQGILLIAPATGVRQRYYAPFAEYFAGRGWDVLTWDWRGVADSRHGMTLADPRLTMRAWGTHDLATAIAWAERRGPDVPLALVGHSFGGQAPGLAANASRLDAMILVAAQHPWLGNWPWHLQPALAAFWWLIVPGLTAVCGRLPSSRIGLGEDLPPGVAREWARWCRSREGMGTWQGHAALRAPVLSFSFADDLIAPPRAAARLLSQYSGSARVAHHHVSRAGLPPQGIGHFGFFRPGVVPGLWDACHDFLQASAADSPTPVPRGR